MANDEWLRAPYDPQQPIESFFDQLETSIELAEAGKAPYTDTQILNVAFTSISQSALYPDDCHEWKHKDDTTKSWTTFKTHFVHAYTDILEGPSTATDAGFHESNMVMDDRHNVDANPFPDVLSTLQASNEHLTNQLNDLTSQLATVFTTIGQRPTTRTRQQHRHPRSHNNYFWTHGFYVGASHTSASCSKPSTGNQTEATGANRMDGNNQGSHLAPHVAPNTPSSTSSQE